MLYAVLDYIRTRVFLIMGDVIGRRLNVPTLEAAVIDTLHGTSKNSTQAIRDLNDLRSFVTGSAITVPLELMWVPLFLIVLFLLHTVYGWLALGAAAFLFLMSVLTDVLTRRPLAQANEAAARSFSDIASTVRNAEVIEAMGMLPAVAKRWQRSQYHMIDLLNRGNSAAKALSAASRALRLILQIAMISTAAVLVIEREASPGSAMAAGILMGRMLQPFEQLIDGWRQWVFALSAFGRVREPPQHGAEPPPEHAPAPARWPADGRPPRLSPARRRPSGPQRHLVLAGIRAKRSASSAPPPPANRRWPACWSASGSPPPAASISTATAPSCGSVRASASMSATCRRTSRCSTARSGKTSPA